MPEPASPPAADDSAELAAKENHWLRHSYKSGGALEAHFGLGKHNNVDLTVKLLDGKRFEFTGVASDVFLDVDIERKKIQAAGVGM